MWSLLLDLVFPRPRSLSAEDRAEILRGPVIRLGTAALRGNGCRHLDGVTAARAYRSVPALDLAIRRCKYSRQPSLCAELAAILAACADDAGEGITLCPVPLHWTRRFARGFNQAELLARGVASRRRWSCETLLVRVRPTGAQAKRGRAERKQAVIGAFAVRGGPVPEHVLLIDDVCTTGATLDDCARALKVAGAKRVSALVLAAG